MDRRTLFLLAPLAIWLAVPALAEPPKKIDLGPLDVMLLRPDGSEEVLVRGGEGSVTDPFVSFDGQWVYYALFHKITNLRADSSDIYKIHVPSKRIVRLTHQEYAPNTGLSGDLKTHPLGIFNLGPCPLPGERVMFVSSRNGLIPPRFYTSSPLLQLFTMDDDGRNVEMIGHLNIGGALHPVPLKDGRVMFNSFESQGLRGLGLWGLWSIHPDGTNWGPLLSAFNGGSVDQITHFQTPARVEGARPADRRLVERRLPHGARARRRPDAALEREAD